MTVKDLVLLYESSSESPTSLDQEQRGKLSTQIQRKVSIQLPPPAPARFIKRSEARLNASPSTRLKGTSCTTQDPLSTTHSTTSHDYGREPRPKNSRFFFPDSSNAFASDNHSPEQESLARLIYPPSSSLANSTDSPLKDPNSISYGYSFPSHKPVPAQTIFARNACALSLPKLDEYLALLSPPDFPDTIRDSTENMFLPMGQLAKADQSLGDLEHNSTVPPFWRDRNQIFGKLLSYTLAILVRESSH